MLQSIGSIRESQERLEDQNLSPLAARSSSATREVDEPPCPLRTAYQRDRDRIIHCKAFRRLKHKTQVFFSPVGDHYRTRLTHTLEVSQVSRTIARALRLNEDLTEAIALAHDLGHPPFGHIGERVLNELYADGFHHYLQSARIARDIERLNLTVDVLDAVSKDTGTEEPSSLEGQLVKMADRMAYLHHDVEDAIRAGLMEEHDLPEEILSVLGRDRDTRLDHMIIDIVENTQACLNRGEARIAMSPGAWEAMSALRKWMFQNIYLTPEMRNQSTKVKRILSELYAHFCEHPELISPNIPESPALERRVVDYIAGMTDRYAIDLYTKLLIPTPFQPHHEERQYL